MDPKEQLAELECLHAKDPQKFLQTIQRDLISAPFISNPPFGIKKSVYCDYFASAKALSGFEDIMRNAVLPFYANTHTSTTSTARFTSESVKHARDTIRRCTNAIATEGHEHQAAIIFCGSGATSGIHKIRSVFRLEDEAYWMRRAAAASRSGSISGSSTAQSSTHSVSPQLQEAALLASCASNKALSLSTPRLLPQDRPVVFLSIQEHHSNLLPWRDSRADVVVIPENSDHRLDLAILEEQLILHHDRPLKLGSFTAGSNITGVLNDTVAISELMHKHGGYAFYDYAGVGPYTTIDMNPPPSNPTIGPFARSLAYKDGVFISTHKFLGGPGASGVLVARVEIFSWAERHNVTGRNEFGPMTPGGGTVDMVTSGEHKYSNNILAREEAGTPNILATIRAGLVFRLQEIVNPAWIIQKEYKLAKMVLARLLSPNLNQTIRVLGASELGRVAVFGLTIAVPRFLAYDRQSPLQIHYALVSTIMNDFFGIEMRSGCMCAGPYAWQLLELDSFKEVAFWKLLVIGQEEAMHPGGSGNSNNDNNSTKSEKSDQGEEKNIHEQVLNNKSLKPGFVRFSFTYFSKDKDVEFVIQSLEWVSQYGYLLVPLYRLNAHTAEWTVRKSVRKAVCANISPKRLTSGSRDHCIPVAIDCIHGLKKLFRERLVAAAGPSREPSSSSIDHRLQRSSYLQVDDHSRFATSTAGNPEVFATLGQAQRSLRKIISGAFGHLSSSTSSSSIEQDANHHRYSSVELFGATTAIAAARGPSNHNEHDDENVHQPGHSLGLPQILEPHSDDSSIASTHPSPVTCANSGSHNNNNANLCPNLGTTGTKPYNNGTYASSIASNDSTDGLKKKPTSMFSSKSPKDHVSQTLLNAAMDELSWDLLQAEVDAVEHTPLAKQMRWFVTPFEVAQMYTQELSYPSSTIVSPFPKQRK
ncbi:hypothetical protein BGZ89_005862 [Linnemannia elongata]|nr:hypothetical protein BGZ89_005862 [Linnemannia elongata]